jgi:glycosyltransferase involved in cell wall biosynthesis
VLQLIKSTDVTIIPSTCMDNTPLSIIESLAYQVPFIATNVPSIATVEGVESVAYLADFDSVKSLRNAISEAANDAHEIRRHTKKFPKVESSVEYCSQLVAIYSRILQRSISRPR